MVTTRPEQYVWQESRSLVREVDASGCPVEIAFWRYEESEQRWLLVFVTKEVDTKGPLFVYRKIDEITRSRAGWTEGEPPEGAEVLFGLEDIRTASPKDEDIAGIFYDNVMQMDHGRQIWKDGIGRFSGWVIIVWTAKDRAERQMVLDTNPPAKPSA